MPVRNRPFSVAALLVACALPISACGSSDNSTGNGSSNQQQRNDQFAKFQACLEEQGVELPERGQGGPPNGQQPPTGTNAQPPTGTNTQPPTGARPGGSQMTEKQQKAFEACQKYMPQRGDGQGPPNGGGGGYGPPAGGAPQQQGTTTNPQS